MCFLTQPAFVCSRCVCESSVCTELVERLRVVMKATMKEALDSLPPKMLAIEGSLGSQAIGRAQEADLATRVERVKARVARATFTSASDKELVPKLYEDYVGKIANTLLSAAVLFAGDDAPRSLLETAGSAGPSRPSPSYAWR